MKEILMDVIPVIFAALGWTAALIEKHKEDVAAVVKAVEAASSMVEWTKEQKLEYAKKLFEEDIYPKLPIYKKLLPKKLVSKWAMKVIDKICIKAKLLK